MSGADPTVRLTSIASGVDVVEGLAQLGGSDRWVNGTGYVEDVELRVATEESDSVTVLNGRFNLLSLVGASGGPFTVTLARLSDAGMQVVGGQLVRARSAGVTVTLQPATRDRVAPPPAKVLGAPATWASAASASAAARARLSEEQAEEPTPEAGDLVQHFAFGLCEVLTSEGDRLRIRDVEGPKRVREVALSMLRVTGPTELEGKRVYQLTRRIPAS
ncbi:MAG TPA: hypothetical protein VK550_04350 [Polyangiaceae bacterium]|jgi:predicted DNA-binding protein with PD1-like motif|nr:hypothetical protein [Polyangiaceae bacterium]